MVRTGFREVMGSWKIMAIWLPRICAQLLGVADLAAGRRPWNQDLGRRTILPGGSREEAQQREGRTPSCRCRISPTRPMRFTLLEVEGDAVDRAHDAGVGV